jgi:hypothetical protein
MGAMAVRFLDPPLNGPQGPSSNRPTVSLPTFLFFILFESTLFYIAISCWACERDALMLMQTYVDPRRWNVGAQL